MICFWKIQEKVSKYNETEILYKIGEMIMLNIVVINCDGKYVEYEWKSKKEFTEDMESDNENIPMLDDPLAEVNTQDDNLQLWWRNTNGMTVDDLLEECKQEFQSKIGG